MLFATIEILRYVRYLASAIVIPLATLVLLRKTLKEKKEIGNFNYIRLIIIAIFSCFALISILQYIVEFNIMPSFNNLFGGNIETFNIYSMLIGTMVSLGLTLAFYANKWEAFYFVMLFIFGGMIILYLLTGFEAWVQIYILMAAIGSLIFMYLTSFRIKDNGALGLSIFFTLVYSTLILDELIIVQVIIMSYNVFIIVFSLGLFRPFKTEVVN